MAGRFADLTVEQLQADIVEYRAALKKIVGGDVGVVAGEGRRLEYTRVNVDQVRAELRDLQAELARRPGFENLRGNRAIAVEIGQ